MASPIVHGYTYDALDRLDYSQWTGANDMDYVLDDAEFDDNFHVGIRLEF